MNPQLAPLPSLPESMQFYPKIREYYEQGLIKPGTPLADQIMLIAKAYSRKTKLIFDGTLKGAFKLAEEAYRTTQEAVEAARKRKGKKGVYDDIPRDESKFVN